MFQYKKHLSLLNCYFIYRDLISKARDNQHIEQRIINALEIENKDNPNTLLTNFKTVFFSLLIFAIVSLLLIVSLRWQTMHMIDVANNFVVHEGINDTIVGDVVSGLLTTLPLTEVFFLFPLSVSLGIYASINSTILYRNHFKSYSRNFITQDLALQEVRSHER